MLTDTNWMEEALCATQSFKQSAFLAGAVKDPSQVFYSITEDDEGKPFRQDRPRHSRYRLREARFERLARATCAECPVRMDCLFYNLELEQEPHGIVGAFDAANRIELMKQDNPRIHKRECRCGIKLYGVKGSVPEACSATCRGEK